MVDGVATFLRRSSGDGSPTIFVHGNPDSEDWSPILGRMRGPAIALDLPGWGRSARPAPKRFDYSMHGLARYFGRFLERMEIGARIWRAPWLGELSTRIWSRRALALGLRESRGDWSPHGPELVEMIWDHLDLGTLDAILRLYRSTPEEELEAAGRGLGSIAAPTMIVWGLKKRYHPARCGRLFAEAIPNSELVELPGVRSLALARSARGDRESRNVPGAEPFLTCECVAPHRLLLPTGEYNLQIVRALVGKVGAWLPNGYGDAARQLGLFVLADLCYETVRGIAEGQRVEAFANGAWIIDFEKATGTFFEADLQSALIGSRWIIDAANFAYMNTHFIITTAFLVWLYIYRNQSFYFVRNMFMVAMALALVGYALVPTAPPRLFPQEGFIDTITAMAQVNHDSALVKVFVNPYAAIPSMHIAFALMIGVSAALISRHAMTRAFWCAYPLFVLFVVVVTANHFWIDAAAGALVAGLAALIARQVLARARPAVWSWRPATA